MKVGRVAFLKPDVRQARGHGARLFPAATRLLAISTPKHVRAEFRRGNGRRSIAAAEIQDLEPLCYAESRDQLFAAFAHALGNAREVAFFPERLVRIYWRSPSEVDFSGKPSIVHLIVGVMECTDVKPGREGDIVHGFAEIAKAAAHPHRLALLEQLAQGERNVDALAERAGLRSPTPPSTFSRCAAPAFSRPAAMASSRSIALPTTACSICWTPSAASPSQRCRSG